MARYSVLLSCPHAHDVIDDYVSTFETYDIEYDLADVDQQLTETELLDCITGYDGVLAGDDEFSACVFEAASDLKVVSKWGIGLDNVDRKAAERTGVAVYNTPGAFADEVANVVIGYTISLTRELYRIDREVRAGNWDCPRGVSLAGRTLGVVGVGNIGSEVIRRGHALGMTVLGCDVEPVPKELKVETGVERIKLNELLQRSSVVSLNCPLTAETRGMIGAVELGRLGHNGYLVNTARGELVEENALVDALIADDIAGAALDVFAEEPLPVDSPLTNLENVILGSHNSQNTEEAVDAVTERAVGNLIKGLTSAESPR